MKIHSAYRSLLIFSIILSVAFAAAWQIMVYRSYSMKAEIESVTTKAREAEKRSSYLLSLQDALASMQGDLKTIDSRFITKEAIPTVIDDIESRAAAADVKIDVGSVDLEEVSDPAVPHALKLHISGSGAWKNVTRFISVAESLPYMARLEGVSMTYTARSWSFSTDAIIYVAN